MLPGLETFSSEFQNLIALMMLADPEKVCRSTTQKVLRLMFFFLLQRPSAAEVLTHPAVTRHERCELEIQQNLYIAMTTKVWSHLEFDLDVFDIV